MQLGRVVGVVVATRKHDKYTGSKLLLVQPIDPRGTDVGDEILAVDSVGAGAGETVLVVIEGRSASQAMRIAESPANAAIVAIVDRIDHDLAEGAESPPGAGS